MHKVFSLRSFRSLKLSSGHPVLPRRPCDLLLSLEM
jgi:hypothetical protein